MRKVKVKEKITKADIELWKKSRVVRDYGSASQKIILTEEELKYRALKERAKDKSEGKR